MNASRPKKGSANSRAPVPKARVEPDFEQRWAGSSALATECLLNLGHLAGILQTRVSALGQPYDITSPTALGILLLLSRTDEPLAPSILAERLVLTRGAVSQVLQTLERRNMVRRVRHAGDGRRLLVKMTPLGKQRYEEFRPLLHSREAKLMSALSIAQQKEFLHFLALLQSKLIQPSA